MGISVTTPAQACGVLGADGDTLLSGGFGPTAKAATCITRLMVGLATVFCLSGMALAGRFCPCSTALGVSLPTDLSCTHG